VYIINEPHTLPSAAARNISPHVSWARLLLPKAWGFLVRTTVKSASLKRIPTCKRVDLPNRLTLIRSNYDEQVCHCLTLGTANAETILNC
jgi:hypothetical protein